MRFLHFIFSYCNSTWVSACISFESTIQKKINFLRNISTTKKQDKIKMNLEELFKHSKTFKVFEFVPQINKRKIPIVSMTFSRLGT